MVKTASVPSSVFPDTLISTISFAGGLAQYGAGQWSANGQLALVFRDAIHVITPTSGLHPQAGIATGFLSSEVLEPGRARTWFGHSTSTIFLRDIFTRSYPPQEILQGDDSTFYNTMLDLAFVNAAWSPKGFGRLDSCLLAILDSELGVSIFAADRNAFFGPWEQKLVLPLPKRGTTERFQLMSSQTTAIIWSPPLASASRKGFLSLVTRAGEVQLWAQSAHDDTQWELVESIETKAQEATLITWSPWKSKRQTQSALIAVFSYKYRILIEVAIKGEDVTLKPITDAPVLPKQIGKACWVDQLLVFTAPGELNIVDSSNLEEPPRILVLMPYGPPPANQYAPAVSLSLVASPVVQLVLEDSSVYLLDIHDLYSKTAPEGELEVLPQSGREVHLLLGKSDLSAKARQLEAHQTLMAHLPDVSSGAPGLYASIKTDDPLGAWTHQPNRTFKLGFMYKSQLHSHDDQGIKICAQRVVSGVLKSAQASTPDTRKPSQIFLPLLAHFATTPLVHKPLFLDAVRQTLEDVLDKVASVDVSARKRRYWLALWAQRQAKRLAEVRKAAASVDLAPYDAILASARARTLSLMLQERLDAVLRAIARGDEDALMEDEDAASSRATALRVAAAAVLWATVDESSVALREQAISLLSSVGIDDRLPEWDRELCKVRPPRTPISLPPLTSSEKCSICSSPLTLALHDATFLARCTHGHLAERCVLTLRALGTPDNLTCAGCGARAALEVGGEGDAEVRGCPACGEAWVCLGT